MGYVVGVYFTQVVSDHFADLKRQGIRPTQADDSLQDRFGSLLISILSLYQSMSNGLDWGDLSGILMNLHPALVLLFSLYIAFSMLCLMNVVTGVFVESALKYAKNDED